MKKLFAYLMAFLMSLKTSTSFTLAPDKPYDENVYKIEAGAPPDYRNLYGTASGEKIVRQCNTNKYASNGKRFNATPNGYWFVDGQEAPENMEDIKFKKEKNGSLTLKKLFGDGSFIIAPVECTLLTKSEGNDCSHMEVKCKIKHVRYKVTFNNMLCWYCDTAREEDEYDHHTGEEQEGTKFRGGQVLGKATEKTTVNIRALVKKSKVNNASGIAYVNTIDQFYYGKYKAKKKDEGL